MHSNSQNTEELILKAAENLFLEKGFARTSTTEIAAEAGCNQALVHYYFRTKEKLFTQIFNRKMELAISYFSGPLDEDCPFTEKIGKIIDAYYDYLASDPRFPYFVLNELLFNKDRVEMIKENVSGNVKYMARFLAFDAAVKNEVLSGGIREIDAMNLMMDIISLCVSSVVALPILGGIVDDFGDIASEYATMRKTEIKTLILKGLKP